MGFLQRWLEKLAATNKASYGTERLDCCDMQRKQTTKNKPSKH